MRWAGDGLNRDSVHAAMKTARVHASIQLMGNFCSAFAAAHKSPSIAEEEAA